MRPDRLQGAADSIAGRVVVRKSLLLLVNVMMSSTFQSHPIATARTWTGRS
jgi:hypothetical protein